MFDLVNNATQKMADANKTLATHALIAQAYATSVTVQQKVYLPDSPELKIHQEEINKCLGAAQTNAEEYQNYIHPKIIQNVVSIDNCYNLLSELPTKLLEGSTVDHWLDALNSVKEYIIEKKNEAQDVVVSSGNLDTTLKEHTQVFLSSVRSLNDDVDGDGGILEQNKALIERIEQQIGTNMLNIVFSAIGSAIGVVLTVVGCCTPYVTGAGAAGLVVAGVVIAGGFGTELVSSAMDMVELQKDKNELIIDDEMIKPEVQLALGISTGYQSFVPKISNVKDAATGMVTAWESLITWVDKVIEDLEKGLLTADKVHAIYLGAIGNEHVTSLRDSIETIKTQMTGVDASIIIPGNGQSVGEVVEAACTKARFSDNVR
ncbi:MAG: alpha-helical pore-forming toxin family protein [Candidatus Thiodiazotropha taylori]|nr:alpha-helical pore-forming toxin family protein [Candidatus Thiodiazotropha taylori]MCW4326817.1 alpha-helical pore-forming toxin family protein [Candidatus Thiodiazotropha taylori]